MTAPLPDPDTVGADLATQTTDLVTRLDTGTITTGNELAGAVDAREQLATMRRSVVDYFAPIKAMAYQLHRALCAKENAILKPIDARDQAIASAMSAFKAEQDRARIEREREEHERQQRELEAAIVHDAAAIERDGDRALAAALLDDAIAIPPKTVVILHDPIKDAGAKFVTRWRWRYVGGPVDVSSTPAAVVARAVDLMPREFLTPDTTKIGAYVRAMKSSGDIPGVEIYAVDEPVR